MGRARIVRTPEKQTTFQEQRRQLIRERIHVRGADAEVQAQEHARVGKRKQQLRSEDPAAFRVNASDNGETRKRRCRQRSVNVAMAGTYSPGPKPDLGGRFSSGTLASAVTSATAWGDTFQLRWLTICTECLGGDFLLY
uniref:Uncharacterized protein n=1 Tax=Rhipicephalus zambeziensis TaxID=60191 RepID=A0A224YFH5_9ACAR